MCVILLLSGWYKCKVGEVVDCVKQIAVQSSERFKIYAKYRSARGKANPRRRSVGDQDINFELCTVVDL